MGKEPNELVDARDLMKRSEANFGAPEILSHLKRGIRLLSDVIMGDCAEIYKDRAKMMAVAYRNKMLLDVNDVLSNSNSYDLDSLEQWHNAMAVFSDGGFDDDQQFRSSKERLFSTWSVRFLSTLSPWELDEINRIHQQRKAAEGK